MLIICLCSQLNQHCLFESGGRRDRGREIEARRRGGGRTWAAGLPQPRGPGRTGLPSGLCAPGGSRGAACERLPAAFSPPPPAPPPGLLLLFNIHLEKLNLASWKPAHSQIPGDFQSLSFSRPAMLDPLVAKPRSRVPASACGPAAHPRPQTRPPPPGGGGRAPEHLPEEPSGMSGS